MLKEKSVLLDIQELARYARNDDVDVVGYHELGYKQVAVTCSLGPCGWCGLSIVARDDYQGKT